jgi:hypothetical protein
MNSPFLIALANHLWQSTLFAIAVGLLTLLLRKNSARIRYALWLAASVKFLVPFALLTTAGSQISLPLGAVDGGTTHAPFISLVGDIAAPVTRFGGERAAAPAQITEGTSSGDIVLIALGLFWTLGMLAVAARWLRAWVRVRRALRDSTTTHMEFVIPVKSSSSRIEPGVIGILRPVLLIPEGLENVTLRIEKDAKGSYRGYYSNEDLRVVVPIAEATFEGSRLIAKIKVIAGVLTLDLSSKTLNGTLEGRDPPIPVTLVRT